MRQLGSINAIASPPPSIAEVVVAEHVQQHYGLEGTLALLVSERDQNFRLRTKAGDYVVKIANVAEDNLVTDFQVRALEHLERRQCPVAVPRVLRTLDGSHLTHLPHDGIRYKLRIVSWLDGEPLEGREATEALARVLGRNLAEIDAALADFHHAGERQELIWDIQRAAELQSLVHHIADDRLRASVGACLDDFESNALPVLGDLRTQVIHNDLNPGNVLTSAANPDEVAGVIDFGDMLRAPLIVDVAVAASYLRRFEDDPIASIVAFVAGFSSVTALGERELRLLYNLLRTRLATTVTILHWRAAARGEDDAYLQKSLAESTAERFMDVLRQVPEGKFTERTIAASRAG